MANGFARPHGGPNCWLSAPGQSQWLQVDFRRPVQIGRVELCFNADPNRFYNNLVPTGHAAIPEIVKDSTVLLREAGEWVEAARVAGNYQRRNSLAWLPHTADALRIETGATWGWPAVEICEVRAYE